MTEGAKPAEDLSFRTVLLWTAASFAIFLVAAALTTGPAQAYLESELGVVESLQAIVLFAAIAVAGVLATRRQLAPHRGLRIWLVLITLGLVYLAGEEISWGQHYFRWATTGWFAIYNDQGETNLHNTSSWLDQKPRALLLLGMIVGGIVHPLVKLARKGRGLFDNPWWLAPTLAALPPAVFAELAAMPERINDVFGLDFQFYRSSEIEEAYLYVFLLVYLLSLRKRLHWHTLIAR